MGSITFSGGSLFGSVSDAVGVKSGLALNKKQIVDILKKHNRFEEFLDINDENVIRIHSTEYESFFHLLLYAVGRLESPIVLPGTIAVFHKYKKDPKANKIREEVGKLYLEFWNNILKDPNLKRGATIDPTPFMNKCFELFGKLGLEISFDFLQTAETNRIASPYSWMPNSTEWKDLIELEDLFKSEGLEASLGEFIDQRYIDYLNRNFEDIDSINWRKFEGLTAEYFARQNLSVEVGAGRNDDGVDVRVWDSKDTEGKPPAIIVQCKRQKEKVSKVIVKSLYADVGHEKAKSGLIVTTSELSPGARKVCHARQYPIEEANREIIKTWISEMRKPGAGIVS